MTKRIGFCVSTMNRLWQLKETLCANLAVLDGTPHFLALVNFNSADDTDGFVRSHCRGHIDAGNLRYFHTVQPTTFHASKAKNLTHRLALLYEADVLFNLDGDNVILPETRRRLELCFADDDAVMIHNWTGAWGDGTFGRIGFSSKNWCHVGGYDESLLPMAWQDADLLFRGRAAGLRYVFDPTGTGVPIPNSMTDKLRSTTLSPSDEVSAAAAFRRMHIENITRSLGRPIIQPLAQQERFAGSLDFHHSLLL